eukprot:5972543-Pyramimonas_sp.AAC.1
MPRQPPQKFLLPWLIAYSYREGLSAQSAILYRVCHSESSSSVWYPCGNKLKWRQGRALYRSEWIECVAVCAPVL